jgi:hypothetical protein
MRQYNEHYNVVRLAANFWAQYTASEVSHGRVNGPVQLNVVYCTTFACFNHPTYRLSWYDWARCTKLTRPAKDKLSFRSYIFPILHSPTTGPRP